MPTPPESETAAQVLAAIEAADRFSQFVLDHSDEQAHEAVYEDHLAIRLILDRARAATVLDSETSPVV